jgi:hypothetical protein
VTAILYVGLYESATEYTYLSGAIGLHGLSALYKRNHTYKYTYKLYSRPMSVNMNNMSYDAHNISKIASKE